MVGRKSAKDDGPWRANGPRSAGTNGRVRYPASLGAATPCSAGRRSPHRPPACPSASVSGPSLSASSVPGRTCRSWSWGWKRSASGGRAALGPPWGGTTVAGATGSSRSTSGSGCSEARRGPPRTATAARSRAPPAPRSAGALSIGARLAHHVGDRPPNRPPLHESVHGERMGALAWRRVPFQPCKRSTVATPFHTGSDSPGRLAPGAC